MDFASVNPWYLLILLLVPYVVIAARVSFADLTARRRRVLTVTRSLVIVLVTLGLLGVLIRSSSPRGEVQVTFCLDVSRSVGDAARQQSMQFIQQAWRSRPADASADVVSFAAEPVAGGEVAPKGEPVVPAVRSGIEDTNIGAALATALARHSPERARRIVLLSDGRQTDGSAQDAAAQAALLGVPIDVVKPIESASKDVALSKLTVPGRTYAGQAAEIGVELLTASAGEAEVRLFVDRAAEVAETARVHLEPGRNFVTFHRAFAGEGLHTLRAVVSADGDPETENDHASTVLQVSGKPKILLLAVDAADVAYLSEALARQDMEIVMKKPGEFSADLSVLREFDAVVLGNVPAEALGDERMTALRRYVYELAGGLVMTGGPGSFAVGGYYRTPVEAALPVRVDPLREAPISAVVLVMDKSWSMGDTLQADVSKIEVSKIDLIKEAAIAALEGLTENDYLGVISFDSDYHVVMDIDACKDRKEKVHTLSTLASFGLTNFYPAMVEAHKRLKGTIAEYKHIVLLSDGRPSGGAKDWQGLLKKITEDKIVVSCIGVGHDAGKKLLTNIASWGKGSVYFTDKAQEVPVIIFREMRRLKELLIVESPLKPRLGRFGRHAVLRGVDLERVPPVLGYNRTRPKETAQVLLTLSAKDEPLLAIWRYGKGQSAALTTDAGDRWCAEWLRTWKDSYARLCRQTVLATVRSFRTENDYRVAVTGKDADRRLQVDCADRAGRFLSGQELRASVFATGENGAPLPEPVVRNLALTSTAPGRYAARLAASVRTPLLILLEHRIENEWLTVAASASPKLPPAELASPGADERLLEDLALMTGGEVNPAPERVFRAAPGAASATYTDSSFFLLFAAAILFAFDVFLRRMPVLKRLLGRPVRRAS